MKIIAGIIVFLLVLFLLFHISVPKLTDCGISAADGAAAGTMKASIFVSQLEFQKACIIDDNNNGIGEFGFLNQLVDHSELKLYAHQRQLAQNINDQGIGQTIGHSYQIFLPDGRGGFYDIESYRKDPRKEDGAAEREQYFLALAWPNEQRVSFEQEVKQYFGIETYRPARRIYVMMQDGQLRSTSLIHVRDAFLANPGWEHIFARDPQTRVVNIDDIDADSWPYWSK